MSDPARDRPRQLTTALWLVVVGSAFHVLSVFDRISTLNTVDTRAEVTKVLASGGGKDLGLSVDQALAGMRVGLTISALCAAAAVVLGIFALQRHRGARLGLTVLAVPLLLLSPLTGGLVGVLVAAAIATTWTGQARDWFAGRPVRERRQPFGGRPPSSSAATPPPSSVHSSTPAEDRQPSPDERPASGDDGPRSADDGPRSADDRPPGRSLSTEETSSAPRPVQGFGNTPVQTPVLDRRPDPAPASAAYSLPSAPGRVPRSVWLACVATWLFAGLVALIYGVMLVVLAVDSDWLVDQVVASPAWTRAGLERDVLVPLLWGACLMFLAWSIAAMVLAFFAWRRHNWARYLLTASAAATIVIGFFAFPFGVPHQIASAYVIWGLFTPAARQWFSLPGQSAPPPSGPSSGDKPPVW